MYIYDIWRYTCSLYLLFHHKVCRLCLRTGNWNTWKYELIWSLHNSVHRIYTQDGQNIQHNLMFLIIMCEFKCMHYPADAYWNCSLFICMHKATWKEMNRFSLHFTLRKRFTQICWLITMVKNEEHITWQYACIFLSISIVIS